MLVRSALVFSILYCASLTASDLLPLQYTHSGGEVQPSIKGEMPNYSIDNEWRKHLKNYPFISPVDPSRTTSAISHENQLYDKVNHLALDLYLPRDVKSAPLVVLIHGGGWRSGHRRHMVPIAKFLAEHGIAAAAVDYRTSRRALYPAGMQDIQNATTWISQNFSVDIHKLAYLGASSGAHMATLLGHRLNNDSQKKVVSAVVNLDGIAETTSKEVRAYEDKPGKISYLALWLGGRFEQQPQLWKEASPLEYVSAFSPATYFINSSQPRFHRGRDEMLNALSQLNISGGHYDLPDTPHTFWLFHPWHEDVLEHTLIFLQNIFENKTIEIKSSVEFTRHSFENLNAYGAWQQYFDRSEHLHSEDMNAISQAQMADAPMLKRREIYREALVTHTAIANLVSFQTPSGGWSKNIDTLSTPRKTGQRFGLQEEYIPTFDNDATFQQIDFLVRALIEDKFPQAKYALHKAINLILDAQFPTGTWPQSFPLQGGYHNWSTYNDGVIANTLNLLLDIEEWPQRFAADAFLLVRIERAITLAVEGILYEQRWINEEMGGWGQQHDPLSGQLRPARAYEMAALSTMESADIARVLMRIENPSPEIKRAIEGAIAWLNHTKISGYRWQRFPNRPSALIPDTGAKDIWPRMVDLASGKAIFGDRNGQTYESVSDISLERQNKYGWYHSGPAQALERYKTWSNIH
jgi:PelA/Pel-15E family pectate lyase